MTDLELEIQWLQEIQQYLTENGEQEKAMRLSFTIKDKLLQLCSRLQQQADEIQHRISCIKEANEL